MKNQGYWHNVWCDFSQSKLTRLGWLFGGVAGSLIAWYLTADGKKAINWHNALVVGTAILGWYVLVFLIFIVKNLVQYIHNTFVDSLYGEIIANLTQLNFQLKEMGKSETINDASLMMLLKKGLQRSKTVFRQEDTRPMWCIYQSYTIKG